MIIQYDQRLANIKVAFIIKRKREVLRHKPTANHKLDNTSFSGCGLFSGFGHDHIFRESESNQAIGKNDNIGPAC